MAALKSYRELRVWERSIEFAEIVYRLSACFPREERFGLTSQIRRSAVSIAANIAEGEERHGTKDFLRFLGIASGSLAETETILVLALRLDAAEPRQIEEALIQADEIGKMLSGLKRSLRSRERAS